MHKRKVGIILQARMGSSRLPGKVLKPLAGKPMVQWIIERLRLCQRPHALILATSNLPSDQPLVDLAQKLGVCVFRGSELDVLDRYYRCAREYQLDDVIRATGDNPFVDPQSGDRLVDFYFRHQLDYAIISTDSEDGFPLGVGLQIFSYVALQTSWHLGHAPHHREHVDEYILENPDLFKQARMPAPPQLHAPDLSLTVDTLMQFKAAENLYYSYLGCHLDGLPPAAWTISMLNTNLRNEDGEYD